MHTMHVLVQCTYDACTRVSYTHDVCICMMHVRMLHMRKIHIHIHAAFIFDPKASIHDASTFDAHICIYMHICMMQVLMMQVCMFA